MLGDCYLKLSVVLKIYTEFGGVQEGKMVKLKSMRVSNRYLFDLAARKSLDEFIVAANCTAREKCLGPWTSARSVASASLAYKLPDKSLADCVEALIGCYLIHLGTRAARVFIEWLGYVISEKNGPASFLPSSSSELCSRAIDSIAPRVSSEMSLADRYAEFEVSTLGYQFRNKAYLYQAFTHPSDTHNNQTSNYQKFVFF